MKVIIVGCTHAGTAAAKQVLAMHPETELTIYERQDNISFLSCGIYLYLGGLVDNLEEMFYATPEELEANGDYVQVQTEHDVIAIDAENKTVQVQDMVTGRIFSDSYDKLVMTTGSNPVVPPIQGIGVPNVLLVKDYAQAQEVYRTAQEKHRVAIVGGGYVGVELAESYSQTGHEVSLINGVHRILSHYVDAPFTDRVTADLRDHGVHLYLDEVAKRFDSDGEKVFIETDKGEREADLAVVCVGFQPVTNLLAGQVEMTENNAIITNEYMQTSNPDIYAAGDSTAIYSNLLKKHTYAPLATNAVRQGALVGMNLYEPTLKYMGTQSTSGMRIYNQNLASTGLTLEAALANGFKADAVVMEDNYRPEFMPSTTPVLMSLVYDQETHLILGCQLYSEHDISQSANLVSVAIQNQNKIEDLAYVDMLFSPNFDRPFNYLNLLAQAAMAKEDHQQTVVQQDRDNRTSK